MSQATGAMRAADFLYPAITPFDQRMLDVGDGHSIYVEQSGNPDGMPVIVLHGGPGGGSSPAMRRYFDPEVYRVILFDQRGCGRSRPHASVADNTTWHLVADIERIRTLLGLDTWIVFGGSWGATLGLLYAQAHRDRVETLVLRGVFLMTRAELDWFYGGGAGAFWPEIWARFVSPIPEDERGNLIEAYHHRLFSGDTTREVFHARRWVMWENALASMRTGGMVGESPAEYARAFARLENHYFRNAGFLDQDGQILRDLPRIADLPIEIVQGRYDLICPPRAAWDIAEGTGRSRLHMIDMAGHAMSEPGITQALVQIMDRLRDRDPRRR